MKQLSNVNGTSGVSERQWEIDSGSTVYPVYKHNAYSREMVVPELAC